jgi:hypothetical protein
VHISGASKPIDYENMMLTKKQKQLISEQRPPRRTVDSVAKKRRAMLYAPTQTGDEFDSNDEDAVDDYGDSSGSEQARDIEDEDDFDEGDWAGSSSDADGDEDDDDYNGSADRRQQRARDEERREQREQFDEDAEEDADRLLNGRGGEPRFRSSAVGQDSDLISKGSAASASAAAAATTRVNADGVAQLNSAAAAYTGSVSRQAFEASVADDRDFMLDEEFDPFKDKDNDPHVYLDAEGNAYFAW